MTRATYNSSFDDLEELRKRFEDFRKQHQTRTRLPEELMAGCGGDRGTTWNKPGLPGLALGRE